MFDLNGWYVSNTKFICQNVVVFNEDMYWFIEDRQGNSLSRQDFYTAEDALKEAEQFVNWD